MTLTAEFHFDFGSPNAYLSHLVIPGIEERTGVKIEYLPVLLGGVFKTTGNVSPAISLAGIENKPAYQQLETTRFLEKHDITDYAMNPFFPVNTLQIMRGALAADVLGVFDKYVDVVYANMWADPKKMDEADIIATALTEGGLNAEEIMAKSQDPEVKAKLIANTEASVGRGNFGSPTFFCGDQMFFGKDKLRDFEEMILDRK
jgi:2-hydroxychromene-2-carboxylate isomerase